MLTAQDDEDGRTGDLIRAARRFSRCHMPRFGGLVDLQLRPAETFLMFTLHHAHRAAGLKPSELAARLDVTAGAVTQLITGLEASGLVVRSMDETDRRAVRVRLTATGEKAMAAGRDAIVRGFSSLIAHLGLDDAARLTELMNRAADFFAQFYENDPGCQSGDCHLRRPIHSQGAPEHRTPPQEE